MEKEPHPPLAWGWGRRRGSSLWSFPSHANMQNHRKAGERLEPQRQRPQVLNEQGSSCLQGAGGPNKGGQNVVHPRRGRAFQAPIHILLPTLYLAHSMLPSSQLRRRVCKSHNVFFPFHLSLQLLLSQHSQRYLHPRSHKPALKDIRAGNGMAQRQSYCCQAWA